MGLDVAVSAGASSVRRFDVTLGHLSAMRFAADTTIERHHHPQATIAVILEGGFSGSYRSDERDCPARSVIVEPAGEQHANRFGRVETSIVTLSLEASRLGGVVEEAAARISFSRDPITEQIARRAASELDRPDDVTPLAVEAAALELVARVTRASRPERRSPWLEATRELVQDRYAESLTLAELADAVGVEPERLARGFRRAYGEPLASYMRRIRVNAAASLLAATDLPIARVAGDVGFADQSHLTRWFARYLDTTPGQYRSSRRRGPTRDG